MRKITLGDSAWVWFVLIKNFIWICFGPTVGPALYGFWHGFIRWLFSLVLVQHYMLQSFESKIFRSIWSPYTTLNVLKQLSVPGLQCSSQLNSFRVQSLKCSCWCLPGHSLSHPLVLALSRSVTEWAQANSGSNPFWMNLSRTFFGEILVWWPAGLPNLFLC